MFRARQQLGATPAGDDAFRVMSYNVLFDGYTSTAQAKAEMFPYARPDALHEMYRMQLVFQEMEEAHADIICLQEMGQAIFRDFFAPMMTPLGFTRSTRARPAPLTRVALYSDPSVISLLHEFPEIAKGFRKIPSVAQFVMLRHRHEDRIVLLVNTHLFFREDADMIRLLQAVAIAREVERVRATHSEPVAVVLCGDLNAFPNTATTAFLLDGVVDDRHRHWAGGPELRHSLALQSACGIPEFTNFAGTFVGTLDYILVSASDLGVRQIFPLFSREDVSHE
ncbi:hypothetical protein PINS_up016273 [Pythium insidiosum]|nr:hypothetical protein PINS_up016273 [Pythium insidiosum]